MVQGIAAHDRIEAFGGEGVGGHLPHDELDAVPTLSASLRARSIETGLMSIAVTIAPRWARNADVNPAPQAKSRTAPSCRGSTASIIARVFGSGPAW